MLAAWEMLAGLTQFAGWEVLSGLAALTCSLYLGAGLSTGAGAAEAARPAQPRPEGGAPKRENSNYEPDAVGGPCST